MSSKTPVIVFLIDGLRHRDHPTRRRIMPSTGFRHAEACLFTGCPPARHGVWTDYVFSQTTPFHAACRLPGLKRLWRLLPREQRRYLSFVLHRLAEITSGVSLPKASLIPPHLLAHARPTQLTAPDAPGAYPGCQSIFDLLRDKNRRWLFLGPPHISYFGARDSLVEKKLHNALRKRRYDFYYVKLGDLDRISHTFGPDSSQARRCRRVTARRIESMKSEILHAHGAVRWILLSDHGFVDVHGVVPVPPWIEESLASNDLVYYFVDSTILRLWLRDPADPGGLGRRMDQLRHASPLEAGIAESLGITPGSPQMGHITYVCEPGMVFWPDFFSARAPRGMHGYAPTDDLACPLEAAGMPLLPDPVSHASVGHLLKDVLASS